jgi:hypothetical protein
MSELDFPNDFVFDPDTEIENPWKPIPSANYAAQVIEAEVEPFKSGKGHGLNLVWSILSGEHEDTRVYQQIIITHDKASAQAFGQRMLKELCGAIGVKGQLRSAEVFLFKPAEIEIYIEKATEPQYDDKNRVKHIRPLDPSGSPAAATPQQPSQTATSDKKPPWAR